jgi:ABC-type nitrate/sulfonate/bicarbonate transport system substrate-binding protein
MTRSRRRKVPPLRVSLVALVAMATAALVGCSSGSSTSSSAAAATGSAGSGASGALPGTTPYDQEKPITPVTSINVAYSAQSADDLYLFAAMNDGIFTREGLSVKATLIQSAPSLSALIAGQVQFDLVGGGDTLSAIAGGASNLRWVGTADTYAAELLYTRPNINGASQLKGITIASTSTAGTSTVCAKLAMQHFGVTDYKIAYLGSVTSDVSALLSGAAQATCANPPGSYQLDAAGEHALWDLTTAKVKLAQTGIATTQTEISTNPGLVQRFLTAMTEGQKVVHASGAATAAADQKLLAQITGGPVTASDAAKTMQFENEVQTGNLTPSTTDLMIGQKYEALVNAAIGKVDLSTVVNASFAQAAATAVYGANPPTVSG